MMIYLDCSAGVAGDMVVGALVDLGADAGLIAKRLRPIASVDFKSVRRKGVGALKFDVKFKPESRMYVDLVKAVKSLELPKKVQSVSVGIPPELFTPPPLPVAVLPEKVQSVSVSAAEAPWL